MKAKMINKLNMGNKMYRNFLVKLSGLLMLLLFTTSCQIGLGNAVDVKAPEIAITSHRDNDSVASSFVLRGSATDNEEVSLITIDFEDADIHYQIIPGNKWKKKIYTSQDWVELDEDDSNYCRGTPGNWSWAIEVITDDKVPSKTDSTYTLSAIVKDRIGNSGRKSKVDCSLIVDEASPEVSVYKPELFTGSYDDVVSETSSYKKEDGNVIARLINGEIQLEGRIEQSLSFKGLNITFDNGQLNSDVRLSTANITNPLGEASIEDLIKENLGSYGSADFTEESGYKVYYSKTIKNSDLRSWTLKVKPEEWATPANGMDTGKHIVRVVSTCLSASDAWERRVLGYFVWYPEADIPWITVNMCDDTDKLDGKYECYPGSTISGSCQDDDGLKSVVSKIYKRNEFNDYVLISGGEKSHLSGDTVKYTAFSIPVPSENGAYKVDIEVKDIYGTPRTLTKYFKTSDVSAPKINISSPSDNTSAITNISGNFTFKGSVTDESLKKVAFVWLNPKNASNVNNKINYLTGSELYWNLAIPEGHTDSNGNIVFSLFNSDITVTSYTIEEKINLFAKPATGADANTKYLGIDGSVAKLTSQEFIFFASDGISNTIKTITLTGDNITPELSFTDITLNGSKQSFTNDNLPAFPVNKGNKPATITGKWSDKFTDSYSNTTKLNNIVVKWGDSEVTAKPNPDGTWSVDITPPASGGTITASISDYAGNTKTVQTAASIETVELGLSRIDCLQDDGAYTTGAELIITLEFTKTTNVSNGTPTLKLNNGGIATYFDGSGTSSHQFKYTVGNNDCEKLDVVSINANGAKWTDASESSGTELNVTAPAQPNLASTRSIKIDKVSPTVAKVYALTQPGYYKAGSQILLMADFNEDVNISNADQIQLQFTHEKSGKKVKTSGGSVSGSKSVFFTYEVSEGDNVAALTFDQIIYTDDVVIKDNAGNELDKTKQPLITNCALSTTKNGKTEFIVIDTTKPEPPVLSFGTQPAALITSEEGTSFTISGEAGADIEYSIDDGKNWQTYSSKVIIRNNGSYKVKARQTDKAGNRSEETSVVSFVINKGDLLKNITATTSNGTFTTGKEIKGKIVFRKAVSLAKGSTVTLNIGNTKLSPITTETVVKINETEAAAKSATEFTFTYTIVDGDYITAANGYLDVTKWSFEKVNFTEYNNVEVDNPLPEVGSAKRFSTNRNIKILTGKPELQSVSFSGEGSAAVLTLTYDRAVSKSGGNIVFEYDEKTGNEYHVPVVLTASEYNELKSNSAISDNYKPGTNGATKNGTTLTNDTATKYILNTDVSDTNAGIVNVFKAANKHKVTVPVISDQVVVINEKTLKVTLGEAYALPVKGAVYKLSIPQGAVVDEVKNINDADTTKTVTAAGVEAPEIRIVKPSYKIYNKSGNGKAELNAGNWVSTTSAYVDMNDVKSATMYLSCRTPNAKIYYKDNVKTTDSVIINSSPILDVKTGAFVDPETFTTKTADAVIPQESELTVLYNASNPVKLGDSYAVDTYDAASGLKIAIAAQAKTLDASGKVTGKSTLSYEYATRSVLKFFLNHYRDGTGESKVIENGNKLNFTDLRIWITGGDSPSGPNSIETFPLAWADTSKYKLMAGSHTRGIYGKWWWVSWDITAPTHIGFLAGDVPSDANTKGPTAWHNADYLWTLSKEQYSLQPGETLLMAAHGDQNDSTNAAKRRDSNYNNYYYFIPYGARFSFNKDKYFTREDMNN